MADPGHSEADLVVAGARCVATMDGARRELEGGWVAVTGGFVSAVGTGPPPPARRAIDATDCLVTPGLVNTHHHMYQNLTRAYPPMTDKPLFGWLQSLYPLWRRLDTEAAYLSAWVGLAELALGGCTTSTDHLYVHPHGAGDLLSAEIEAAREIGLRFHPTRGSMSLSAKDGGLPPDDVVDDDDRILAASEEAVHRHHDRSRGAMTRIALAPCSPFTVTENLMVRSVELAERLDVRLHTHFAENAEDDEFSMATFGCRPTEYLQRTGWMTDRAWLAHCVTPDAEDIRRLGAAAVGVAHCPSSNLILASGIAPVVPLRAAGVVVGLGVDGSASADSASLWLEARQAMLLAKLRDGAGAGTARMALEMATLGGAACLARTGELGVLAPGAAGDVAIWSLSGPLFAGAIADPIEAWLRCGPGTARDTIVHGKVIVEAGRVVHPDLDERLAAHRRVAGADPALTAGSGPLGPDCPAMKDRSAVPARLAAALAAAVAVGAACSSERDTVTAPPFGTVEVPPVTIPPFAPSPSVSAVAVESVAMVGDSITAGSQDVLAAGLGALGLDDVEIDAVSGRRMLVDGSIDSGLDAVESITQSDPPDLWVIALGTNDVGNYRPEEYGPAVAELLAAVPADAPLIWVDTYLEARPDESSAFNDVLRLSLEARGRSMLVDWSSIAAQDGVLYDGVHPSDFGVQAFSDRVVAAVDAWSA